EDADFRAAIESTGRRKVVMAGLWTEVCLAFPTLDMLLEGYEVYPVIAPTKGNPMTSETKSDSRPLVTVTLDEARSISAYTVNVPDGTVVGRADFVDTEAGERIFFHTEVDREFAGQGLAGMLLREALADSIRKSITVVPVCPLFANHL